MQNEPLHFSVILPSPVGASVDVAFSGVAQVESWTPDPHANARVRAAVQHAVHVIVGGGLTRNELALPTLAPSLPHLVPAIVQQSNAQLAGQGLSIAGLSLSASVPQHAIVPAAAAIAAAPSPLASVASNFTGNVANHVMGSMPTGVKVSVGGWSVRADADGVDGDHLADQVADKAKDKLLGCAIVGGTVLVLGLITMGVLVKIILIG
jgi:hypothetical protein